MTSDDIDFMLFGPRTCVCCGETFPANSEHFVRDATLPSGLKARCKRCVAETERRRYRADPQRQIARQQRYRAQKAARA